MAPPTLHSPLSPYSPPPACHVELPAPVLLSSSQKNFDEERVRKSCSNCLFVLFPLFTAVIPASFPPLSPSPPSNTECDFTVHRKCEQKVVIDGFLPQHTNYITNPSPCVMCTQLTSQAPPPVLLVHTTYVTSPSPCVVVSSSVWVGIYTCNTCAGRVQSRARGVWGGGSFPVPKHSIFPP